MSLNSLSKARVRVGQLFIGDGPSAGGRGAVGGTGSPAGIKQTGTVTSTSLSWSALTGGAATGAQSQTVTCTGAQVGDMVIATPNAGLQNALVFAAFVSTADTVKITIANSSSGPLTPTAGTWTILWLRLV